MRGSLSAAVLVLAYLMQGTALAGSPNHPFPQHLTYAPGTIFPSHRTQAQLDDDVRAAYASWKTRYLAQAGTEPGGQPRYRVLFSSDPLDKTVSEGQGYGMMIVALMAGHDPDAQTIFDGLWQYFNDHRSTIDSRLMDFSVPADESPEPGDDDSAFDGDCDIAFALLLADAQWGSGGAIDYRTQALDVLAGVLGSTIGPNSRLPMLGDFVGPSGPTYNEYTPRSSDFMTDHFHAFARATGDPVWSDVVTAVQQSVDSLQANHSPVTGLLPDFIVPVSAIDHTPMPAPPDFLEGPNDGDYYYNAGRDPWRLGTDALLNADPVSLAETQRMATWIRASTAGVPLDIKPGYLLDGTPIPPGDFFTSFFAAPFGVAAMTEPNQQQWLNDVYDTVFAAVEEYYEDSVTLLCLLVMSRNFWDPSVPPGPLPGLVIDDAYVTEGNAGTTTAVFRVSLTPAATQLATVAYATADGSATAGSDYLAASGTLSFQPGTSSASINVSVIGDASVETDETFLVTLSAPTNATVSDGQALGTISDDDAPSLSQDELAHGSSLVETLEALPGPLPDVDYFRIAQRPRSSYELVIDAASGDLLPLLLDRLAADNVTVLQAAAPLGAGSLSLRFENPSPVPITNQQLRVQSGGCTTDCTPEDVYRIRAYDTTYTAARFNNSGTQVSVLLVQNTSSSPVTGNVWLWSAAGTLAASAPLSLGPHQSLALNTAAIAPATSGSITISSDARYGSVSGKAVSVEPATGFTFDTPLLPRPR
jgi:hypothetical protein